MKGAQALIRTLVDAGVTTCFTNPGTSEMHFVAALDSVPEMRAVLALFEGVATGRRRRLRAHGGRPGRDAAAPRPGPGQRAREPAQRAPRARSRSSTSSATTRPTTCSTTRRCSPTSRRVARNVSGWVRTSKSPAELAGDAAEAVAAAAGPPGQVATLILPADVSWDDGAQPAARPSPPAPPAAAAARRDRAGRAGAARRARRCASCSAAGRCASAGWSRPAGSPPRPARTLLAETFPTRMQRGAGLPAVERLAYVPEFARSSSTA